MVSFIWPVNAKNNVKKATIGVILPHICMSQKPQKIVEQVIGFWCMEFKQMLPDQSDLIVLTEACDHPSGLSTDVQFKYFQVCKDQVLDYFRTVAKENQCYIAFGMKHQVENGSWRNSCFFLDRNSNTTGLNPDYSSGEEFAHQIVALNF